jgi:hypothetical protein
VRFIQLFHRGWDQHTNLPKQITGQSRDTDQASAALILDLKQRGLLEDTLVVWGGEFGRTDYCQGKLTADDTVGTSSTLFHPVDGRRGIRPGVTRLARRTITVTTSPRDPVHVHDLHATILHCPGIDHTQLTFKFLGRHFRLTDVLERLWKRF